MKAVAIIALITFLSISVARADDASDSATRDILVTFENAGASATGSNFSAPYRNRKRYSIAATARRNARAIAGEYQLTEIDHWPIRSLAVYCFVYRIPEGQDRNDIIKRLRSDARVESVQAQLQFETGTDQLSGYNDKYVGLQHGLSLLGISSAHLYSRGEGVRIAVVDSNADTNHEDLAGRIKKTSVFIRKKQASDERHGTAITSIIGALANNELGIVGVAPAANIELFVSCWAEKDKAGAICDSFTLAKALDALFVDPPDIVNLSLSGPYDPLLARLLDAVIEKGVIVVAADTEGSEQDENFPAMLDGVIGVKSSGAVMISDTSTDRQTIFAPGQQIMVALPDDNYDFRSGSSLAAAHVSGVIALLLARSPNQTQASVASLLRQSQKDNMSTSTSIDACVVLYLAEGSADCVSQVHTELSSKLEPGT